MTWRESPCSLDVLKDVDCVFSIDENGNSDLRGVKASSTENINIKWFTVTGILIKMEHFNIIKEDLVDLKLKYWENGMHDNSRVVFHSRDIRKKQGPFNPKKIDYPSFMEDLNTFLSDSPVKIYSTSINKYKHTSQYVNPYPVYPIALEFMVERFCFELRRNDMTGVLVLESRGINEDRIILEQLKLLLENGNDYFDCDDFNNIKGVYFNPKRTKNKKKSYWQLELADLYSYSVHKFVKTNEKDANFLAFEDKIMGFPNYEGKGIKIFPK